MKSHRETQHLNIWFTPKRRSAVTAIMLLILLLATLLRLYELDVDSLWGDEVYEVLNARRDLVSILTNNPLAIRLAMAHTFILIGNQDFLFRFPYAIAGILGVALTYQVGKALFDDITGIIGAILLAIAPLHIQYAQMARSYSLTVLLVLTSLYCVLRALQDNELKHWAGFAFLTTLSLNNHLTAASVAVSEIAYAALVLLMEGLSRQRKERTSIRNRLSSLQKQSSLADWLRWLRSSREALFILSSLGGIVLFLLFSASWFSYLSQIGVSSVDPSTGGNDAPVIRMSQTFIRRLLADFSAGKGPVLYLYGAGFTIGLLTCAIDRQWRQLLLAPIWILPPFFILSRLSATARLSSGHLIFVLPIYLLFAARGIIGIGELVTRYLRLPARSKKLLQGACIVLVTAAVAWCSIPGVQAYYKERTENWKGAAKLLSDKAGPGDMVVQLPIWPTDPLRYYMEEQAGPTEVLFAELQDLDGTAFPAAVWWVIQVGQPGTRPSPLAAPEDLGGSEFDVHYFYSHPFKSPAVLRRDTPITSHADLLQVAAKVTLVQAQSDAWKYFEGYMKRVSRIASLLETSPDQSGCPSEYLDPEKHIQAAIEQSGNAQKQKALDSTLKAMALYELQYPGQGRPHESVLQALYTLGDDALASGHQACAVLFYSHAAEAYMLDVETNPESVSHWQALAEALVKAARYEEAADAYQRLLELAPGNLEYHAGLARAYRASGQPEKGIPTLEQAVVLAPADPQLLRYLGDAYFLDDRMAEAAITFQKILDITPGDIEARFGLALAYDSLGREAEAIQELRTMIETDPDHWLVPEAEEKLDALEQ